MLARTIGLAALLFIRRIAHGATCLPLLCSNSTASPQSKERTARTTSRGASSRFVVAPQGREVELAPDRSQQLQQFARSVLERWQSSCQRSEMSKAYPFRCRTAFQRGDSSFRRGRPLETYDPGFEPRHRDDGQRVWQRDLYLQALQNRAMTRRSCTLDRVVRLQLQGGCRNLALRSCMSLWDGHAEALDTVQRQEQWTQ
ncbi:hypothetical protein ABIE13_003788 [Ottowia thiooxydans]|uniref:Lysozyme inhibitor LprI N-terminal domain-containing protein n=1 Tax=Ottowia thiooxydans TaxID=219182 RepID=A0ABV2QCA3_9BURK